MKSITVFCGSSLGTKNKFHEEAFSLGQKLAHQKISVVYGGAKIGLMGKVAEGALSAGGNVTGIIPHFLTEKEILHTELTELIVVNTMHERKKLMNETCDGFIALPGGFGTLEELFEILTWAQLGLHQKPIGLLNIDGFFDDLDKMIQKMVDTEFLREENKNMLLKSETIDDLLTQMQKYEAPEIPKWINLQDT